MRAVGVLLFVVFPTLAGGTIEIGELAQGQWAVGFVIVPGCPACEEALTWFSRAAQAFPEIRFLLVAPWSTDELMRLAGAIPVHIDRGGLFGASLGVKRAPTIIFLAAGVPVHRLDWPFDETRLKEGIEELLAYPVLNPQALLGCPAPDFSASTFDGQTVSLASLPKPFLLVFFNPGCPGCWEDFPALAEVSKEVAIVLLVVGEVSADERARLRAFWEGVEGQRVMVLLAKTFEVVEAYQVARSPTYFLIDEKGVIVWVQEGSFIPGAVEEVRGVLEGLREGKQGEK